MKNSFGSWVVLLKYLHIANAITLKYTTNISEEVPYAFYAPKVVSGASLIENSVFQPYVSVNKNRTVISMFSGDGLAKGYCWLKALQRIYASDFENVNSIWYHELFTGFYGVEGQTPSTIPPSIAGHGFSYVTDINGKIWDVVYGGSVCLYRQPTNNFYQMDQGKNNLI
jgi:hypothetical protein